LIASLCAAPVAADEFEVNVSPKNARILYIPGAEGVGLPGCLPDAYHCVFGLELALVFKVDVPSAVAQVSTLKLHGNDAAFADHPEERLLIEDAAAVLLRDAIFNVEHGPPLDRTVFTAEFPMSDLNFEFFRQSLVAISGGPELTAVNGTGYVFSYPVPEPESWMLTSLVGLVMLACCAGKWRTTQLSSKHGTMVWIAGD
jgi:hypothetical protein